MQLFIIEKQFSPLKTNTFSPLLFTSFLFAMKPYLCLCLAAALLAACKKEEADPNGLPPATQEGKNTGGFLLNGQPWLPAKNPSLPGTSPVGANWISRINRGGKALQIILERHPSSNDYTALNFIFSDVRHAGTFNLNQDIDPVVISGSRPPYALYSMYQPIPKRLFYTGSAARGQIIITRFDTVARVVAGTFEAKLKEDRGPDSLSITQGRFDLKF